MKRLIFLILLALLPMMASAYDAKINGISYNFSGSEAEVTYSNNDNTTNYSGSVVIPESVTYNGKPYSVTSIGNGAFGNCSGLTSVSIPESVTSIGHWAFQGCRSLSSVIIPNGVTVINQGVFANCSALTSVIIPDNVTSIDIAAFSNCGSLTSVTIPNNVTSIGNGAFAYCRSLTSIIIPEGITKIGYGTFQNCSSLTSFIIPNSVTTIDGEAFLDCSSLASVTIPNGVTNIEDGAFYGCSSLTDVYCYATEPPGVSTPYEDEVWDGYPFNQYYIKEHTTLHVPASSLEKYKTALRWSDFCNIVAIPHQPLPFLEGNPIWVFKHEHIARLRDPNITCWIDTGDLYYSYYFLGGQKEIEGKVYTMMGEVISNTEGEITLNHWLPVREENGIVYAYTDSLPGFTENDYDCRYNDIDNPMPYLRQGNECVLYNFSTDIGETLYPQNGGSTVKSFDTYLLLDETECRVLKTTWGHYDLYEKLGFPNNDQDFGIMDPLLAKPVPTNGDVFISKLNDFYQNGTMLYKIPDPQEGLCVNDTCWTRQEAIVYAQTYKADPYHDDVMAYIRSLQTATEGNVTIGGLNYFLYLDRHEAVLTGGNNCSGEVDIPSEVNYNEETFVVKSMVYNAFYYNSELTKVKIPKSIESIRHSYPYDPDDEDAPTGMVSSDHMNPFKGCTALESIEVDEENPSFKSVDDVLFSKDGTRLYCYPAGAQRESYTIPDGVEWIGTGVFEHNQYISTLTIPNSLKQICNYIFADCSNLKDVYCYAEDVPVTFSNAFKDFLIASATLHVPAGSIDLYKTTSPWSEFGNIVAMPVKYFPEGTKWTEIRLDTLMYDSWYSKVNGEWVPNFETIEYYVQGEYTDEDIIYKKVYTNGPEWTDSLAFLIYEGYWYYNGNNCVLATGMDINNDGSFYVMWPAETYQFDWSIGKGLYYCDLFDSNTTGIFRYHFYYGVIEEIKEGYFGGVKPLKYVDLNGKAPVDNVQGLFYNCDTKGGRIIQGIGVTEWEGGECLFGPPNLNSLNWYYRKRYYRSMLVHFERNGEVLYDVWPEKEITTEDLVTFTQGQMATIILPTEPDASKGKYYKLDRHEEGKIIFEQELQPQARVPYIIVPNEDFSIDLSTMDLEGLSHDAVSIEGISFIGSYSHEEFSYQEGFYIDIIDTTPDCLDDWFGSGKAIVGPLRAYLQVNWDDPYTQGGTKDPQKIKEIVLKDHGTGLNEIQDSKSKIQNESVIFDLQGRRISGKPARGIYIEDGKKRMVK